MNDNDNALKYFWHVDTISIKFCNIKLQVSTSVVPN